MKQARLADDGGDAAANVIDMHADFPESDGWNKHLAAV
jgi:hypothetical protein